MNTRPGSIRSLLAVGVTATLVLAACGGDDDDTADTTDTTATTATTEASGESSADAAPVEGDVITIAGFAFGGVTEVAVGTTVTVVNEDGSDHTWTADDGTFSSGNLAPGDTFEFTFTEPGTYTFACRIHPTMTGTITVTG